MSTSQAINSTDAARWIEPAHFPKDLLTQIFANLFWEDMSRVILVNHHWSSVCSSSPLLNHFIYRPFLLRDLPHIRLDEKTNCELLYKECIRLGKAFGSGTCTMSQQHDISCVKITNDLLCLGSTTGVVTLHDLKTKEEWSLPGRLNRPIRTIKTQNNYLCVHTLYGDLSIWDLETKEQLSIIGLEEAVSFEITDDNLLCVEDTIEYNKINVWSLEKKATALL